MFVRNIILLLITGILWPITTFIGLFLGNLLNIINVWNFSLAGYDTPFFIQKFMQFIIGSGLGGLLTGVVIVMLAAKLTPSSFRWWVPIILPVLVITFNSLEILLRISEGMWNTILWWEYFGMLAWLSAFVYTLVEVNPLFKEEKYNEANEEDIKDEVNKE